METDGHAYRYERQALLWDYARATGGIVVALGLAVLAGRGAVVFWPLVALAGVFTAFAFLVAIKHRTVLIVGERGLACRIALPLPAPVLRTLGAGELAWDDLTRLRLRFFGGRKGKGGVMQMRLSNGRRTVGFDGDLEHFDRIAGYCAFKAVDRGVVFDPSTEGNLAHFGIKIG